jgi:octaprenyl-diphosphate synthase
MNAELNSIKLVIKDELREFDDFFHHSLKSRITLLNHVLRFLLKKKGKQIRPLLVLLSAGMHGKINEKSFRAASLAELLHQATLIHDDVVDDSHERRGTFSINALWKNKVAVLAGDYLFSRGMLIALQNKDVEMLEITSEAVKLMSEGELLQIEKARTLSIDEDVYFEIIRMKTASLIASCCALGAASVSNDPEIIAQMHTIGEKAGLAFQIRDDILDFFPLKTGKPGGTDLKEKKLTLPLIYTLNNIDKKRRKKLLSQISGSVKRKQAFAEVTSIIRENNGFGYAEEKMLHFRNEALEMLSHFPESNYRIAFERLVNYITSRES